MSGVATTLPCHCRRYTLDISPMGVIAFVHDTSDQTIHTYLMCHDHVVTPRLSRQQLLDRLRELKELGDAEIAHGEADDALITYIDDIEIAQAFNDIDKWYA
jgi:hypothetical protein